MPLSDHGRQAFSSARAPLPPQSPCVQALLDDKIGFLSKARLGVYDSKRNDPNADAVSGLSGYFHFGHLAPQRAALEAGKHRKTQKVGTNRDTKRCWCSHGVPFVVFS